MPRPRSQPFFAHITPEYEKLHRLSTNRHQRNHLLGFMGYAASKGLKPEEVCDETLGDYGSILERQGRRRFKKEIRSAAKAWNKCQQEFEQWPKIQLHVPAHQPAPNPNLDDLAPSLKEDILNYLNRSGGDDLFDGPETKPLAPATKKDRLNKIRQILGLSCQAGKPLSSLLSLADLYEEKLLKNIITQIWQGNNKKKNGHATNRVRLLKIIAKYYVHAAPEIIQLLHNAERNLRPAKSGMTQRNRNKLRQLITSDNTLRLRQCAEKYYDKLLNLKPSLTQAVHLQSALASGILLCAPMREKNLASLDLERHFDRINKDICYIIIEGDEVKNEQNLEYLLPPYLIKILDHYLTHYRPLLLKDKVSSALFISRNGRMKAPEELGAQIRLFLRREVQIEINVHLFRHLSAYLFLKKFPGEYEAVRQLLGHKSIKSTIEFYTGLEQIENFKRYDEILADLSVAERRHD